MTHEDWMHALGAHVRRMRAAYPNEELVVCFDIDGTIVDTRHLVVHLLLSYDRAHGTNHFHGIGAEDISAHEIRVDEILAPFSLPTSVREDVRAWYLAHLRDTETIAAAHRPYQGVLSVIRWFQIQPRMHVALNTGRPEHLRRVTLDQLNDLGRLHRVRFDPDLLFMNEGGWDADIARSKVEGLRRLQARGYRVVAVVDNEPAMLRAMAEADETGEILFLHADTIFDSRREPTPRTVSGSTYGLAGLVDEADLGRRVTFVWHGINDAHNLGAFLDSSVRWAELDVRRDPLGRLVLRHDSFDERPWNRDERLVPIVEALDALRSHDRAVKLDLKDGDAIDEVLEVTWRLGFPDEALWFNADIDVIGPDGFEHLRRARPGSIRQCPIDFLGPLLLAVPRMAQGVLGMLADLGVTRVSLDWSTPRMRELLDVLEDAGWEVNVYGVPDLEAFLEAALLLPTSVTADFNFPEWGYHGRGPTPSVRPRTLAPA